MTPADPVAAAGVSPALVFNLSLPLGVPASWWTRLRLVFTRAVRSYDYGSDYWIDMKRVGGVWYVIRDSRGSA